MNYLPKQNLEAEKAVLGAVLLDNASIKQIELKTDDFYRNSHAEIFAAMLQLTADGSPVDLITITEKIGEEHTPELITFASSAVTAANVKYHAEIVAEAARMRKLQRLAVQTLQKVEGSDDNSETIIAGIHSQTKDIISNQGGDIVSMHDVAKETMDFIERRHEDKGKISGVPSGFKDIDAITDGFQPSDLIILGARPSMGKTALSLQIATNAAEKGFPVGVLSLEMGSQALGIRSIASLSQVELWKLRKGILKREDLSALYTAIARCAALPIYFSFSAFDLEHIRKVIAQMVEVKGAKMIIVDYLQLAKNTKQKTREREIGEISTTLKQCAKTFNVPVLALSQLSRELEKRAAEERRPKLSDLRDSGQLEQDADVVMFLFRDNPKEVQGTVEVHFAKGRNIGLGVAKLYFNGMTMTMSDGSGRQ